MDQEHLKHCYLKLKKQVKIEKALQKVGQKREILHTTRVYWGRTWIESYRIRKDEQKCDEKTAEQIWVVWARKDLKWGNA